MTRLVILAITLASAASTTHRSQGYAGSTPVGLDGQVALVALDCAEINADPMRGRVRTPLPDECRLAIPSADGRSLVRTAPAPDGSTTLTATGGLVIRGLNQPTILLWKPDASGFLLNGGEGSGQVSHLRYYQRTGTGWRSTSRLDAAAAAFYKRRFDCRAGRKSYVNTSGWNWTRAGMLRVIVQEGVHSEGCLQPHEDRNVLFEVIGDPVTGRISSAREIAALP